MDQNSVGLKEMCACASVVWSTAVEKVWSCTNACGVSLQAKTALRVTFLLQVCVLLRSMHSNVNPVVGGGFRGIVLR
jgi:hypothetical protein